MKTYKRYSSIIEWSLAILLILVCSKILFPGSFTPLKAHEQSEKSVYYGPSDVIKTVDLGREKIYLCRYKDWFSESTVRRKIIKWYPVNYPVGHPIDYSKQLTFNAYTSRSTENSKPITKIYGYVNDPKIKTIILEDKNKEKILTYILDESKMFIFYWDEVTQENKTTYLKGLDSDGNVIYEEEVVGF